MMTITGIEFNQAAQQFLKRWSDSHSDGEVEQQRLSLYRFVRGWHYEENKIPFSENSLGYLISEPYDRLLSITGGSGRTTSESQASIESDLIDEFGRDEEVLDTSLEQRGPKNGQSYRPIRIKCWIAYSDSYMVPQLFFDAFKPDGVSLTLEELLNSNIFIQSNFQQHPKSINSLLDNYPFSTLPINPSTSPLQTPKHQQDDSSDFLNFRFLSRVDNPMIENRDAWVSRSCWSIHPCNTHKALEDILSAEDCRKILPVDLIESYFVLISTLIDLRSHQ